MILSHDRERGRVSLSTKKLEPTPGDMIRNPKLVFEKVSSLLTRVIYFCYFCTDAAFSCYTWIYLHRLTCFGLSATMLQSHFIS